MFRLQSDRGLPILPKLFADVKFRGREHEVNNMKVQIAMFTQSGEW